MKGEVRTRSDARGRDTTLILGKGEEFVRRGGAVRAQEKKGVIFFFVFQKRAERKRKEKPVKGGVRALEVGGCRKPEEGGTREERLFFAEREAEAGGGG